MTLFAAAVSKLGDQHRTKTDKLSFVSHDRSRRRLRESRDLLAFHFSFQPSRLRETGKERTKRTKRVALFIFYCFSRRMGEYPDYRSARSTKEKYIITRQDDKCGKKRRHLSSRLLPLNGIAARTRNNEDVTFDWLPFRVANLATVQTRWRMWKSVCVRARRKVEPRVKIGKPDRAHARVLYGSSYLSSSPDSSLIPPRFLPDSSPDSSPARVHRISVCPRMRASTKQLCWL